MPASVAPRRQLLLLYVLEYPVCAPHAALHFYHVSQRHMDGKSEKPELGAEKKDKPQKMDRLPELLSKPGDPFFL